MNRRTVIAVAGWLTAALAATLLGVAAIGLAGESITGTPGGILDDEQVAAALASPYAAVSPGGAPPASPGSSAAPSSSPAASSPAPEQRTFSVAGGSAVAECVAGEVRLATWTPAQGYAVTDVDRGPDDDAEVTFEGPGGRFEIRVHCQGAVPTQDHTGDDD